MEQRKNYYVRVNINVSRVWSFAGVYHANDLSQLEADDLSPSTVEEILQDFIQKGVNFKYSYGIGNNLEKFIKLVLDNEIITIIPHRNVIRINDFSDFIRAIRNKEISREAILQVRNYAADLYDKIKNQIFKYK